METLPQKKDDALPFVIMDKLDDELIVQELQGKLPEILTYHFSDKGQDVWGLSKAGVDEATGELAKQGEVIRELDLQFTDGEKEAFFNVKCGRFVINRDGKEILLDTKFGTKRQSKQTRKKDGTSTDNPFWYEQGSMKAARNASLRLIPKTIQQAVIESAKQKGKVKEVKVDDVVMNGSPISREPQTETDGLTIFTIKEVLKRDGETKGKAWTLYTIIVDQGDVKFTTFDSEIAVLAKHFKAKRIPCIIGFDEGPKGKTIKQLEEYIEREPGDEDEQ